MLLFTCPKPFSDPFIAMLQKNALRSWRQHVTDSRIVLMGNEAGVAKAAQEWDVEHISDIEYNEYGTPVVSSIFQRAEKMARDGEILAYINCDIVLFDDFLQAVQVCQNNKGQYLLVGERCDFDVHHEVAVHDAAEWTQLRNQAMSNGKYHGQAGLDYFVFRPGLFDRIPPFSLGRWSWDNWLLWAAKARGAKLIDGTDSVFALHQDHDYGHVHQGNNELRAGPEAEVNRELAAGHLFDLVNCPYCIEDNRIVVARSPKHIQRRKERLCRKMPWLMRGLYSYKLRHLAGYSTLACRLPR